MSRWRVGVAAMVVGAGTAWAETGKAVIRGTTEGSQVAGVAVLEETPAGVKVVVTVAHASPGLHGLHIHQYGRCEDGGQAAVGHYNPDGVKHGFVTNDGLRQAHAGDLGNIEIGEDGTGSLELVAPSVRLSGDRYTVGGRAIILHEKEDDFGQPTGNAGGRIGCGVMTITGE